MTKDFLGLGRPELRFPRGRLTTSLSMLRFASAIKLVHEA
jgi:hypothetical protein